MPDDEIVEVYLAANTSEAHFLCNLLVDAGIEARVIGDFANLGLPPGDETAPCLWVHRRDEDKSRLLLAEWEKTRVTPQADKKPAETWTCPACREVVDADFDLCWNCQNPRQPY